MCGEGEWGEGKNMDDLKAERRQVWGLKGKREREKERGRKRGRKKKRKRERERERGYI